MLRDQLFNRAHREGGGASAAGRGGPGAIGGHAGHGGEIARIEGLSDAVFAFAVTLLVVSLEVPKTFGELLEAMRGFGAFALAFALLLYIWHRQYLFFRRYALEDGWTLTLNGALLFVVLYFVYPLKFLASFMIDEVIGAPLSVRLPGGAVVPRVAVGQAPTILVVYGLGYAGVFLVFTLLYIHAYRRRAELGLDPVQALLTRESIGEGALQTAIGVTSVLIAALGGQRLVALAGFIYFLIAPALTIHGMAMGKKRERLEERLRHAAEPAEPEEPEEAQTVAVAAAPADP